MHVKGLGLEEYERAIREHGSIRRAAKALNVNPRTITRSLASARRRESLDPEVVSTLEGDGYSTLSAIHSGWIRKENPDGGFTSVYFQAGKEQAEATTLIDALQDAFADLRPAQPPIAPEPDADESLLTVYPIADAHIGMLAWGEETGEDYDTDIASERIRTWMEDVCDAAPSSDTAIILDVGDLLHADDHKNMTPGSGHILDNDTRYFKTVDVTIQTLVHCIDTALGKHPRVIVSILKGNHDPNAYVAILYALSAYYRNVPRVEVLKQPGDFFVTQWGECLIAANHGDKAKVGATVMMLADRYAGIWGATKWRYLFTGHKHSSKVQDIGGVVWEQLRAISSSDYYAASHAWLGKAQISAITYHKHKGVRRRAYCGQ